MSILSITLAGQRAAEMRMLDTCRVERNGEPATDSDTGKVSPSRVSIYEGKCEIQAQVTRVQESTSAEHQFGMMRSEVKLPMAAGPFRMNDYVTITASALSPQMVGMVFRISGVQPKSFQTAQRFQVEVFSS